jgi:hypothetical protein
LDNKVFGVRLGAAELAILGGWPVNRREFCLRSAYVGIAQGGTLPPIFWNDEVTARLLKKTFEQ